MRRLKFGSMGLGRLVATGVAMMALAACPDPAARTPVVGPVTTALLDRDDCFARNTEFRAGENFAVVAGLCREAYDDTSRSLDQTANAAYNAARGFNLAAAFSDQRPQRLSYFQSAAEAALTSLDRVGTDHPSLRFSATATDEANLATRRFRLGRTYELARAYFGLSDYSDERSDLCGVETDCLSASIANLRPDLAQQLRTDEDTRYDDFLLLRARAFAKRARPGDWAQAKASFEELIGRDVIDAPVGRADLIDFARLELADISLQAGWEALGEDDDDVRSSFNPTTAIASFQDAVRVSSVAPRGADAAEQSRQANRYLRDANLGLGQAHMKLAQNGSNRSSDNYCSAIDAFGEAIRIASAEGAAGNDVQAEARDGRGQAIEALIALETPFCSGAAKTLRAAIEDYEIASGFDTDNSALRSRYAKALSADGQDARAEEVYARLIEDLTRENSLPSRIVAEAWLELAEVRGDPSTDTGGVLTALRNASEAAPRSFVLPQLKLGEYYVAKNRNQDARAAFIRVVDLTGGDRPPAPDQAGYKATAYFNLSVIDARIAGDPLSNTYVLPERAVLNAERAVELGGGQIEHFKQACLARILRGRESVGADNSENAAACARVDTADGYLMHGMFHMRRAQYVAERSAKSTSREFAQSLLDQGLREVERSGEGGRVSFSWPTVSESSAVNQIDVDALLTYGKAVIVGCSSNLTVRPDLDDDVRARARRFFEFYHVFQCRRD